MAKNEFLNIMWSFSALFKKKSSGVSLPRQSTSPSIWNNTQTNFDSSAPYDLVYTDIDWKLVNFPTNISKLPAILTSVWDWNFALWFERKSIPIVYEEIYDLEKVTYNFTWHTQNLNSSFRQPFAFYWDVWFNGSIQFPWTENINNFQISTVEWCSGYQADDEIDTSPLSLVLPWSAENTSSFFSFWWRSVATKYTNVRKIDKNDTSWISVWNLWFSSAFCWKLSACFIDESNFLIVWWQWDTHIYTYNHTTDTTITKVATFPWISSMPTSCVQWANWLYYIIHNWFYTYNLVTDTLTAIDLTIKSWLLVSVWNYIYVLWYTTFTWASWLRVQAYSPLLWTQTILPSLSEPTYWWYAHYREEDGYIYLWFWYNFDTNINESFNPKIHRFLPPLTT